MVYGIQKRYVLFSCVAVIGFVKDATHPPSTISSTTSIIMRDYRGL